MGPGQVSRNSRLAGSERTREIMATQTLTRRNGASSTGAADDDSAGSSAGGRAPASGTTSPGTSAATVAARPMTGSALLCEALKAHAVRVIFGYPGGAALPLYRELANHMPG